MSTLEASSIIIQYNIDIPLVKEVALHKHYLKGQAYENENVP
jgi:hypothetical protein